MVGRSIQTYLYATMYLVTTLQMSSYNASSFAMRHKLHLELLNTWNFYLKQTDRIAHLSRQKQDWHMWEQKWHL